MKSMIYLITKAKWKKSSKRKEKRFRERMRAEMGMIRVRQQPRSKTAARMQCSSIVAEMERLQEEVALKREETSALRQQQLREEETMVEAILQNLNQHRLLNACLLLQHSCSQHLLDLLIPHFLG